LLTSKVESFNKLFNDLEECEMLLDMALDESDTDTIEEVSLQIKAIDKEISKLSLELMLDEADDKNNAIVSINAGAGGTDAQDWAEMLF